MIIRHYMHKVKCTISTITVHLTLCIFIIDHAQTLVYDVITETNHNKQEGMKMTKSELLKELNTQLDGKGMNRLDGINGNSRKEEIQNAIDCLACSDGLLDDYMTVIKLKYPNTHRTISNNGSWKRHPHNRLYVFNTARLLLQ